ncbi:MAG: MarR family transcriptional regulator [Eubacterium sp.]|nr:MarR family transcriptional regulator [Eubacterium sp.]
MKQDTLKTLIDACTYARKILSFLPDLPKEISPRQIRILGTIHDLQQDCEQVKISDIADTMHVTRPSITRLIGELESLNLVNKEQSKTDRRIFTLELTDLGAKYYQVYVEDYYREMASILRDFTDRRLLDASASLIEVYQTLEQSGLGEKTWNLKED